MFFVFFCVCRMGDMYFGFIGICFFYSFLQYDVGSGDIKLVVYFNYGVVFLRCYNNVVY